MFELNALWILSEFLVVALYSHWLQSLGRLVWVKVWLWLCCHRNCNYVLFQDALTFCEFLEIKIRICNHIRCNHTWFPYVVTLCELWGWIFVLLCKQTDYNYTWFRHVSVFDLDGGIRRWFVFTVIATKYFSFMLELNMSVKIVFSCPGQLNKWHCLSGPWPSLGAN